MPFYLGLVAGSVADYEGTSQFAFGRLFLLI